MGVATAFVAIGFTNYKHKQLKFGAAYFCHIALEFSATVSVLMLGLQYNTLTIQACLKMVFGSSLILMSDLQRFGSAEVLLVSSFPVRSRFDTGIQYIFSRSAGSQI